MRIKFAVRHAGARLARAAEALGMRVCGSNSRTTPADLAALISSADVVSLVSCPSSKPTPPVSACALTFVGHECGHRRARSA